VLGRHHDLTFESDSHGLHSEAASEAGPVGLPEPVRAMAPGRRRLRLAAWPDFRAPGPTRRVGPGQGGRSESGPWQGHGRRRVRVTVGPRLRVRDPVQVAHRAVTVTAARALPVTLAESAEPRPPEPPPGRPARARTAPGPGPPSHRPGPLGRSRGRRGHPQAGPPGRTAVRPWDAGPGAAESESEAQAAERRRRPRGS
jgi:hypothetical protein